MKTFSGSGRDDPITIQGVIGAKLYWAVRAWNNSILGRD